VPGAAPKWRRKSSSEFPSINDIAGQAAITERITPLPLPSCPKRPASQSHTLRTRFKHRMQVWKIACNMILVINGLECGNAISQQNKNMPRYALDEKIRHAQELAVADILADAAKHARARRDHLSGAHTAAAALVRAVDVSDYHIKMKKTPPQVSLIADAVAEPSTPDCINMLVALPLEEAEYYRHEHHVVDLVGKSEIIFQELVQQYGFVGGEKEQYIKYLARPDVSALWHWELLQDAKAIAGISAVPKKNPEQQRKLLMQVPAIIGKTFVTAATWACMEAEPSPVYT
jgi:hypothetical protein